MSLVPFKIFISDKSGSVTCESTEAENPEAVVVLAHGAGAGMNHPFMLNLAAELASKNISSVRFQFPYMEQGKKRPDTPKVAQETILKVIFETQNKYPSLPVYAGGKSFGGRMTSLLFASQPIDNIKGLIFYGFPLHPPGKPSTTRAVHLKDISLPMLFLQGTRDKLATPELLEEVLNPLSETTFQFIQDADHSFHVLKKSGYTDQDILKQLATSTSDWTKQSEIA